MPRAPRNARALAALIGAWGLACLAGMAVVIDHESAPGAQGQPPRTWPPDTTLARDPRQPTLVLFAHPRCPCLRATMVELARVVSHVRGRVGVEVVLELPPDADRAWTHPAALGPIEDMPEVAVVADVDGIEAARFGALTSGLALLYDVRGRLRFSGGITPSRAHEGDNVGATAVTALLAGDTPPTHRAPVFGCSLVTRPAA